MKNALAQHLISVGLEVSDDSLDPITDFIKQINQMIHDMYISPLEFDRNIKLFKTQLTDLVIDPEDPRSAGFYHVFFETLTVDGFNFISNLINRDIRVSVIRRKPRHLTGCGEHTREHYEDWLRIAQAYQTRAFPELPPETQRTLARLNVSILHSVW